MNIVLTPIEARVLGCLIEKETATPEYYPLTLNALVNACNQKSNRDPAMNLTDAETQGALDTLHEKQLVYQRTTTGSRATKYAHRVREAIPLAPQELAVLCLLLLRGPQTPGELRGRADRLCQFADLREVDTVLQALAQRPDGPLVACLPRAKGTRESRYAHLLCGPVTAAEPAAAPTTAAEAPAPAARPADLEAEVARLRRDVDDIARRLAALQAPAAAQPEPAPPPRG